jgi:hypothetical protein
MCVHVCAVECVSDGERINYFAIHVGNFVNHDDRPFAIVALIDLISRFSYFVISEKNRFLLCHIVVIENVHLLQPGGRTSH